MFYKRNESSTNFLTINAQGGLANRMRAIASSVSLANDLKRNLRIIWQTTSEMAALFYDLFEQTDFLPQVESMNKIYYILTYEIPRKKNIFFSHFYQSIFYYECLSEAKGTINRWLDKPDELKERIENIKGNVLISSGLDFYKSELIDYHNLFHPNDKVKSIIDDITSNFDNNTFGIHIRRTDNKKSIINSPTPFFENYIRNIINCNEKARFYVASDDYDEKRNLKNKFGEKIIVTDFPLTRSTVAGTVYALSEMYALASTNSIAGSYWSSFSEIAARIGNIPLYILSK